MRVLMLIGIVALMGLSAAAQGVPNSSLLLAMPFASPFTASGYSNDAIAPTAMLPAAANLVTPVSPASGSLSMTRTFPPSAASAEPGPDPQQVKGVYRRYAWQAYAGYTFFRFYSTLFSPLSSAAFQNRLCKRCSSLPSSLPRLCPNSCVPSARNFPRNESSDMDKRPIVVATPPATARRQKKVEAVRHFCDGNQRAH